jgi:hypothetical protein
MQAPEFLKIVAGRVAPMQAMDFQNGKAILSHRRGIFGIEPRLPKPCRPVIVRECASANREYRPWCPDIEKFRVLARYLPHQLKRLVDSGQPFACFTQM